APSAKGDDKFINTDYLQQCPSMCTTAVRRLALL
ncbi:recombinase family protein, partial [Escherichia coli]